jgi:hypothetical protein
LFARFAQETKQSKSMALEGIWRAGAPECLSVNLWNLRFLEGNEWEVDHHLGQTTSKKGC